MHLRRLVAAGLRLLLSARHAALYRLQVLDLQLVVDDFLVAHRVDTAVDMRDIVIVKTAQHMEYGICLADIGKKLVAQTLSLARTFHKAGDIDNLHRGRNHAARIAHLHKLVESFVRHGYDTHVGLYGAERKITRLGLGVGETVKQGRLAHVGQTYDTAFE